MRDYPTPTMKGGFALKIFATTGRVISTVRDKIGITASYLIYPIICLIVFEVFLRYVLNRPTIYTYDLIWMSYGALIFLGGAYCLNHNVHVRADILYNKFSNLGQFLVNVICYPLFFFTAMAAFVYSTYDLMIKAWEYGEISRYTSWGPPTGPIKTILFVAFVMLTAQGVVKFFQLLKGDREVQQNPTVKLGDDDEGGEDS